MESEPAGEIVAVALVVVVVVAMLHLVSHVDCALRQATGDIDHRSSRVMGLVFWVAWRRCPFLFPPLPTLSVLPCPAAYTVEILS